MSAGYMAKCARKKRYETRAEAEAHRGAMIARGQWRRADTNSYRCNNCGGWHDGHVGSRNRGKR